MLLNLDPIRIFVPTASILGYKWSSRYGVPLLDKIPTEFPTQIYYLL